MTDAVNNTELVRQMMDIARAAYEAGDMREQCGAVVRDGGAISVVRCENASLEPTKRFKISAQEWGLLHVKHEEVLAVWHSHVNLSAAPSPADLADIEKHGLPWHIVSWPQAGHSYTEPSGYQAPYEGRQFEHGSQDCYTLVSDWYRREMGIELPDVEREEHWWEKGFDLYRDGFEKHGFVRIPFSANGLKRGDGFLMQVVSPVPNHAGVYLGNGHMLHHVQDRLSQIVVYGGFWLKNTTHFLRHKSQL